MNSTYLTKFPIDLNMLKELLSKAERCPQCNGDVATLMCNPTIKTPYMIECVYCSYRGSWAVSPEKALYDWNSWCNYLNDKDTL